MQVFKVRKKGENHKTQWNPRVVCALMIISFHQELSIPITRSHTVLVPHEFKLPQK